MYFSSHLSDKQYFLSQKIDKNVVYLATTEDRSGLTRQELQCVVTRNETLSGYRNCIHIVTVARNCLASRDDARQFWSRPDEKHDNSGRETKREAGFDK